MQNVRNRDVSMGELGTLVNASRLSFTVFLPAQTATAISFILR